MRILKIITNIYGKDREKGKEKVLDKTDSKQSK